MQRLFTNILCDDVEKSAEFYEQLLGMTRGFDSDWFILLTHADKPGLELALLLRSHEIVPAVLHAPLQRDNGVMVTIVVDDTDAVYRKAQEMGVTVIESPTDMFYGQRRMLLEDPAGIIIDISAPTAQVNM